MNLNPLSSSPPTTPMSCCGTKAAAAVMEATEVIPNQIGVPAGQLGHRVAAASEFQNGQMKTVQVGDETVLLCRVDNAFYATSAKCTHVGAPLEKGVLNGGRIVCPWHGACFNVKTGDIEEGMVMEPLKTYRVHVVQGEVYVSHGERRIAIVGGGASASAAVDQLCKAGFEGRVDVFSEEAFLPYDRTKCSKILTKGNFLRPAEFYARFSNVHIHLETKVVSVDGIGRSIETQDGRKFFFDAVLLATGGIPRHITTKSFSNVYTLRNAVDAEKIRSVLNPTTSLVIIGAGLLGLELASAARLISKVENVTVIDSGRRGRDLKGLFGGTVFESVHRLHHQNGVKLLQGPARSFQESADGTSATGAVIHEEGGGHSVVAGDLFVVVIGIVPATTYLKNIPTEPDGTLLIDVHCRVIGASDVFASGDITTLVDPKRGKVHVEHWGWAMQQGRVAAQNMIGVAVRFHCVPVFWTMHFGQNYRFCGTTIAARPSNVRHNILETLIGVFKAKPAQPDVVEAVVVGEPAKFEVYYIANGDISGVASLNSDPAVAASAELLRRNEMITGKELEQGVRPPTRLQQLQALGNRPATP